VDDPKNPDSFRWHQIIKFIDLNQNDLQPFDKKKQVYCFLGFCCDEGVKRNLGRIGAAKAPQSIRTEMSNFPKLFENEVRIFDAGNIQDPDSDLETLQEVLGILVARILSLNMFPIILGGGHEVAFGSYLGLRRFYPTEKLGVFNFDAHFDLRPSNQESNSGNSFKLMAKEAQKHGRLFSYFVFGIQTYGNTRSLFKTANKINCQYVLAKEIELEDYQPILQKVDHFVDKNDLIYISICSDVFSSAFAPGVSSPQPFGLRPEVVLKFFKRIIKSQKMVLLDVAEVSPRFDADNRTAKLVAIFIFALINNREKINLPFSS
jgi:formiminoglutamase